MVKREQEGGHAAVRTCLVAAEIRASGNPNVAITGVSSDPRSVKPGDLFICLSGHRDDGHDYAAQAVENGAAALLVEKEVRLSVPT